MFLVKDQLEKVRIKEIRRKEEINEEKTVRNVEKIKVTAEDVALAVEEEKRRLEEYVKKEVVGCFDAIDQGKLDALTPKNIKSVFECFNEDISDKECQLIIEKFDTAGSGKINLIDFHREMHDTIIEGTTEEHIRMVFDVMDADGNGVLGLDEIMVEFAKLGYHITKEEGLDELAKLDTTDTGLFNYEMFRDFCFSLDDRSSWEPLVLVDDLESVVGA